YSFVCADLALHSFPTRRSSDLGEVTAVAAQRLRHYLPVHKDHLRNAFGRPARAVFPGLSEMWTEVEVICGRQFFLSGAGPALFALATDRLDARRQEARLAQRGLTPYAARTVKHARVAIKFADDPRIGYP